MQQRVYLKGALRCYCPNRTPPSLGRHCPTAKWIASSVCGSSLENKKTFGLSAAIRFSCLPSIKKLLETDTGFPGLPSRHWPHPDLLTFSMAVTSCAVASWDLCFHDCLEEHKNVHQPLFKNLGGHLSIQLCCSKVAAQVSTNKPFPLLNMRTLGPQTYGTMGPWKSSCKSKSNLELIFPQERMFFFKKSSAIRSWFFSLSTQLLKLHCIFFRPVFSSISSCPLGSFCKIRRVSYSLARPLESHERQQEAKAKEATAKGWASRSLKPSGAARRRVQFTARPLTIPDPGHFF